MIPRGRHPKKEVADVLAAARDLGFQVVEIYRGHRWGKLVCLGCGKEDPVHCTPRNPGHHARQLERFVERHDRCPRSGTVLTFRPRRR